MEEPDVSASGQGRTPVQVRLKPFLRPGLDVLFVGLNPPEQSNTRGHYFSGRQSRFFKLLGLSGLTTREVDKSVGDDVVFGDTEFNYNGASFGVVDLVDDVVQTDSSDVRVERHHVDRLLERIDEYEPRFVCVILAKVANKLNSSHRLTGPLRPGISGQLLEGCPSEWVFNYFPNGNNVSDDVKLRVFREIRERL
jgi:G:T/U-mismatch repair DNA glycosylase